LIIAFENQVVSILNWTGPWEVEEELQELAEGFGYYFAMGNHWNIGFYPLDERAPLPPANATYNELLRDERWSAKRNRIVKRSEGRCENCGLKTTRLDVHHCYYRYGRMPWQYPDASLLALCREFHKTRPELELKWRSFIPRLKIEELRELQQAMDKGLYWFDRRRFFSFLAMLSHHDVEQLDRLRWLLETRGHPAERDDHA